MDEADQLLPESNPAPPNVPPRPPMPLTVSKILASTLKSATNGIPPPLLSPTCEGAGTWRTSDVGRSIDTQGVHIPI